MKTVFVTVGTTRFDELIESITSPENIQVKKMRFKQNNVLLFFLYKLLLLLYNFSINSVIILYIVMAICAAY